MVYARKKCGGASCYLIAPDNVAAFNWLSGMACLWAYIHIGFDSNKIYA